MTMMTIQMLLRVAAEARVSPTTLVAIQTIAKVAKETRHAGLGTVG
jgi:hypothetical protein